MNYEDMSDFEINKLVATHESLIINESQSLSKSPSSVMVNDIIQSFMFDPCNDPSDGWPIMDTNNISVTTDGCGFWNADILSTINSDDENVSFECFTLTGFTQDKNPLRAAMICFLKMKDAENEK